MSRHARAPDATEDGHRDATVLAPWLPLIAAVAGAALGVPLSLIAERMLHRRRRFAWPARTGASAATAALFAVVAGVFGLVWELPAYLCLAAAAVILGTVDLAEKRLPNAVVYPTLLVMVLLLTGAAAMSGAWPALLGAGAGAVGLFAVYFVLALISPAGIGMGDVKLAAVIGLALGYLGWATFLVGATAGFIVGGGMSAVALLTGRVNIKGSTPFGPAMLAGAFLALALYRLDL
ncbi:prepilin peptidase [Homoserinimonas sp. A520]